MKLLLDAFWRASLYCLMPRVIAMSLLPLLLVVGGAVALMYFFSTPIIDVINAWLRSWVLYDTAMGWLHRAGLDVIQNLLAHIVLLMALTPLLVLIAMLLVNLMATPMAASLVVERRFPGLERRQGLTFPGSLLWTLWSFLLALLLLILTAVLWLIPPFILAFFLPPLIWGWFAYRISSYDVLVSYCTRAETKEITHEHRSWLMLIGVASAFLGAIPSFGSLFLLGALDPIRFYFIVMPVSIWLYTVVFMFSALWFAHYCIAVVAQRRSRLAVDKEHPGNAAPDVVPAHQTLPRDKATFADKAVEDAQMVESPASGSTAPADPADAPVATSPTTTAQAPAPKKKSWF